MIPPVLLVAVLLAGCQQQPNGAVPVTTTPPPTAYAQIDAVRTALGGDWSPLDEVLDARCTVEGGAPDGGRQAVVTTTSEASRDRAAVGDAGQLAFDALGASGDTVEPFTWSGFRTVVTSTDIAGNRTTVTIESQFAEIRREGPCVDVG